MHLLRGDAKRENAIQVRQHSLSQLPAATLTHYIEEIAMQFVTFEKLNPDGLSGIRWTFYSLDSMTLVVDRYEEFTRATKRHKKQTNRFWSRKHSRESRMVEADVPLTEEVAEEAKKTFLARLDRGICVGFQR